MNNTHSSLKILMHCLLVTASVMPMLQAHAESQAETQAEEIVMEQTMKSAEEKTTEQAAKPVMRCGSGMSMESKKDKSMDMSKSMSKDMSIELSKDSGQNAPMEMDMRMQGGSAPANARDPHAWSDGYTHNPDYPLEMADEKYFGMLMFDRLERVDANEAITAFETRAWFGRDYDKLLIMAEGELVDDTLGESTSGVFWGHAVSTFWDTQLGLRHDGGLAKNRNWLGYGVQGLAPYWFEIRAMAYLGDNGRTALGFTADYELLFTQQLILQPAIEINAYGKPDELNGLDSGVADVTAGLRLRYEFTRQFAPYVGLEWLKLYGDAATSNTPSSNTPSSNTHWVAGLKFWF